MKFLSLAQILIRETGAHSYFIYSKKVIFTRNEIQVLLFCTRE